MVWGELFLRVKNMFWGVFSLPACSTTQRDTQEQVLAHLDISPLMVSYECKGNLWDKKKRGNVWKIKNVAMTFVATFFFRDHKIAQIRVFFCTENSDQFLFKK